MAKILKNKGAPAGLDLGQIGDMLTTQNQNIQTRQVVEIETARERQQKVAAARKKAMGINEQARADAATIRDQQLDVMDGVNSQLDKARAAMALADSDNPMDRLQLWFLQQQDPGYTREGNLERINYLQQASGALGDIDVLQQAGYADQIAATQELLNIELAEQDDRLALVELQEKQGQELIDAEIAAQNTRAGVIQHQNNMQTQALSNMTDDQVKLTVRQAAASPNQSANVGGIEISLARLQAHEAAVDQQRYNEEVIRLNTADMTLANLTMPELQQAEQDALSNKKRRTDINGVSVPLGRITDRIYNLNNQEVSEAQNQAALLGTQDAVIKRAQQNVLDAMLMPQIESIVQNGFTDPNTGIKYDSAMVRATRDSKYQDSLAIAANQTTLAAMQNPVSAATQTQQQIDSIIPNLPPNSPAIAALNFSKQGLAIAANQMASGDPAMVQNGVRMIQAAQENINAQLDSEAKRLAAGDKEMETAYQFSLRGEQIPPDLIRSTLMERAVKEEHAGQFLTPEQNAIFKATYYSAKARIQQESMTSAFQLDKADIESQAAEEAVNAVMNQVAAPISDALLVMQANVSAAPTSPVARVFTQTEFAAVLRNADTLGIDAFITGMGIGEEEAALIRSGQSSPAGLQEAQNAQLYMALERKQQGLGDAYAQWWASPDSATMVDQYMTAQLASAGRDFTKMAGYSLVFPITKDSMANYGMTFESGRAQVYQNRIAEEHANFVTFGGNQQTKQVFLLQQTQNLTDQERQIGMQQIIQPILNNIAASGITDPSQISLAVESGLQQFQPETPQARSVLGKILAGRDSALKVVDDFTQVRSTEILPGFGAASGAIGAGVGMAAGAIGGMIPQGVNSNYRWFTDMNQSGVQQRTTPLNRGMQ